MLHAERQGGPDGRRLVLCADDYGLTPGIGRAIRRLIGAGRLSAASCMTGGPAWPAEAALLAPLAGRADIGLHFQLTDGRPLGPMPRLAPGGGLPALGRLIGHAVLGRVDPAEVAGELQRQLDRFEAHLGRPPDYLDGHHHVHLLPGVREAVLDVFARRLAPTGAWLRQSAMPAGDLLRHRVAPLRTVAIDLLGLGFRRRARRAGWRGNGGFRGVRDFTAAEDYPALFRRWLAPAPAPLLVMCHPGEMDDDADDPIAACRAQELRFLASDAFPAALAAAGVHVGRLP